MPEILWNDSGNAKNCPVDLSRYETISLKGSKDSERLQLLRSFLSSIFIDFSNLAPSKS